MRQLAMIGSAILGAFGLAPTARAADARLVSRAFHGDEVVRIEGRAGVQATIAFGADEHIENVAVGDAEKWQITPNKRADLLFIKPLGETARTNMTVVTDRHTYFFDLVATPAAKPIYMLRFTYADEPARAAVAGSVAGAGAGTVAAAPAMTGGDLPPDPALLNFAWKREGPSRLLPSRVYDDGSSTYLLWGADQALPAMLVRDAQGSEGPVNFAVRGNTIVLDSVPAVIVLRSGRGEASLTDQRNSAAQPPVTPLPSPAPSAPAAGS